MNTCVYAIAFPSDYTEDVVHEIGSFMRIPIDDDLFDEALFEEDFNSAKNIAKFYDPKNKENLIVACCFDLNILHRVLVRCESNRADTVKAKLLEIDTRLRTMHKQRINTELDDLSNDPRFGLCYYENKYGVRFD
jgi:hypothetical protein